MKKDKLKFYYYFIASLVLVSLLVGAMLFWKSKKLEAQVDYGVANANLRGFAWSDNAGWISFNSKDCDINGNGTFEGASESAPTGCPTSGPVTYYGVTIATSTSEKYLYGYAWSSNLGWISFNRQTCSSGADMGKFCMQNSDCASPGDCIDSSIGATGAPPLAPYNGSEKYIAKYDKNTTRLTGWAKVLNTGNNGWIRLDDMGDINATDLVLDMSFNYDNMDWNNKIASSSVGNIEGILKGDARPARGKSGWGVDLDNNGGVDDYVELGTNNFNFTKNGSFSISAWVKSDNMNLLQTIISDRVNLGRGWSAFIENNKFYFGLFDSGGDKILAETNNTFSASAWRHVVMTYNGSGFGGMNIYVNGKQELISDLSAGTVNSISGNLDSYIGSEFGTTNFFQGQMDEVRVYKDVLTVDEALKLYQNGVSLNFVAADDADFNGWAWGGRTIKICSGGSNEGKECTVNGDCPSSTCGANQYNDSSIGRISLNSKNCDVDENNFIDNYNSYSVSAANNFSSTNKQYNAITKLTNGNVMIVSGASSNNGEYFIYKDNGGFVQGGNFGISTFMWPAVAALPNGNALVVYKGVGNMGTAVIYNQSSNSISAPIIFSNSAEYIQAKVLTNNKILIAYFDSSANKSYIHIFNPATNQFDVSRISFQNNIVNFISITALNNGDALVAYRDLIQNPLKGKYFIYYASSGTISPPITFSSDDINSITTATLTNSKVIIVYDSITLKGMFTIYDIDSGNLSAPKNFSNTQPSYLSAASLKNGNAVIAYTNNPANNLYYSVYDYYGNKISNPVLIKNNNAIKDINSTFLDNGDVFVVYDGGTGNDGMFNIISPKGCGGDNLTTPVYQYKVYTKDPDVINSPPLAINMKAPNLSTNQLCGTSLITKDARNINLSWDFFDLEGGSQVFYQIILDKTDRLITDLEFLPVEGNTNYLNTGKTSGSAANILPKTWSDVVIEYDRPYYWWARVWDNRGESSRWIKYNTEPDTNNNDAVSDTFTTYKHEFPNPYFKWFPLEPSKEEKTLFSQISQYYTYGGPTASILNTCDDASCNYLWASSSPFTTILNRTASSTNIILGKAKSNNQDISLQVTDQDNYSCGTSTRFSGNLKLPIWKEVKY